MTRRATFYAVSEPVLRDISNLRLLASAGRLHPPLLLAAMGRYNEAISEYEANIRLGGDSTSVQSFPGFCFGKGRTTERS
jgi:hypothetical protein